jgi:catechol 2,3-dioxygenase-like lactoylglutathione lyase family enzyme
MGIKVLEIHHQAVRVDMGERPLSAVYDFYGDVLGLSHDEGRPTIPGVPGMWLNVGNVGQIHLIGGAVPSPLAKRPDQDPTAPHVALAVADIVETKAELDRMGVPYWSLQNVAGPNAEQVFVNDPCGNMVELHQVDKCRCRASSRKN